MRRGERREKERKNTWRERKRDRGLHKMRRQSKRERKDGLLEERKRDRKVAREWRK